jgi:4F5 protein related disordered region
MTRGNQREKAREKNLKKQAQTKKKQEGDPKKRLEAQADIMRQKQKEGRYRVATIL